jgi:hypothetical protein
LEGSQENEKIDMKQEKEPQPIILSENDQALTISETKAQFY